MAIAASLLPPRDRARWVLPLALVGSTAQGHEHRFFFFGKLKLFHRHWSRASISCLICCILKQLVTAWNGEGITSRVG
ncbi:MAG: hypothetical protein H0U76_17645 [Ktedonobacteraceae bacterium]|nr:hypothetical protein [Ktedonobacteraceae bacterium]